MAVTRDGKTECTIFEECLAIRQSRVFELAGQIVTLLRATSSTLDPQLIKPSSLNRPIWLIF